MNDPFSWVYVFFSFVLLHWNSWGNWLIKKEGLFQLLVLEVHSSRSGSSIGSASGENIPAGQGLRWHRVSYGKRECACVHASPYRSTIIRSLGLYPNDLIQSHHFLKVPTLIIMMELSFLPVRTINIRPWEPRGQVFKHWQYGKKEDNIACVAVGSSPKFVVLCILIKIFSLVVVKTVNNSSGFIS